MYLSFVVYCCKCRDLFRQWTRNPFQTMLGTYKCCAQ